MRFDLFISYSRHDNHQGRIAELVQQIAADYQGFAKQELRCFFDAQDIHGMDDWRHRILEGLREARLFLACLSPAYLESEYCAWEFNEYLKHEAGRALLGQGVAPIYFVEVPGWEDKDFGQRCAEWVAELRRRQHFDLRPWFDEGIDALHNAAVRQRLDQLNAQIRDRLHRVELAFGAPGNVDRPNECFVGRVQELRRLHEMVGLGKMGVVTAVHGLGGIGKTALAVQYAHAYADCYPGGRWQVRCEGRDDLRQALLSLVGTRGLEFEFTDEQKRDPDAQFERLLAELKRRALQATPSRVLLILDNVDKPELLAPAQIARLPREDWLHVIATSRLGESELFGRQKDRSFLAVDELPEEDALALIESHQPGGKFADETERAAAREIVQLLGRFTLAVETAAVYLGQFSDDVTCVAFRDRLRREGLLGLDGAAGETTEGVLHGEKRISVTLQPTLERLGEKERLVLAYACLLPADHIALPWIRAVVAKEYPELGTDAEPGHPDPWQNLVRRVISLRLLQLTGVIDAQGRVLVVRMHRLVQAYVRGDDESTVLWRERGLLEHIAGRAEFLWDGWLEHANRWELEPLVACAWQWLERPGINDTFLANQAQGPLVSLGRYDEAESLIRRAVEILERDQGPEGRDTLTSIQNLAHVLHMKGEYDAAEVLARRAVEGKESVLGPDDPSTLSGLDILGGVLWSKGDYPAAEHMYRRAMEGIARVLGPDHPNTLIIVNNLALVLECQHEYEEAEHLLRRAFETKERVLGREHPETLTGLYNIANLLETKGDNEAAEPLYRRVVETEERVLYPEHPDTLFTLHSLARTLANMGDYEIAESLYRRTAEARRRVLGPQHPLTLDSEVGLAEVLRDKEEWDQSESLYRRVLEVRSASLGPDRKGTLASLDALAHFLSIKGDCAAAEPLFRQVVVAEERVLGPEDSSFGVTLNNFALLLRKLGKLDEAEAHARRALAIREKVYGPDNAKVSHGLMNLAIGLVMQGRLGESKQHLARAWRVQHGSLDITSARILFIRLAAAWLGMTGRLTTDSPRGQEVCDASLEVGTFLGQLKSLLTGGPLSNKGNVPRRWDIGYFTAHLRQRLPATQVNLLEALVTMHNGGAPVASLDAFPAWRDQPAVPLNTPWPDEPAGNP